VPRVGRLLLEVRYSSLFGGVIKDTEFKIRYIHGDIIKSINYVKEIE